MFSKMLKRVLLDDKISNELEDGDKRLIKLDVEKVKIKNMPAFELERTLRIREEVEALLEEQRENCLKKQNEIEERWQSALKEKAFIDAALEKLTQYNNVARRVENRWKKKALDDYSVFLTTNQKIGHLEKNNRILKRQLQGLNDELKVARVYKQIIQEVHAESKGGFQTLTQIPDKFFLLHQVVRELLRKELIAIEANISSRSNEKKFVNRKICELHACDSYGYELQIYQEGLLLELRRLERIVVESQRKNGANILLLASLKASILNLYLGICTALHRDPIVKREDYESQLKQIKLFLCEMKKLNENSMDGTPESSIAVSVEELKGGSLLRQKIANKKQSMRVVV